MQDPESDSPHVRQLGAADIDAMRSLLAVFGEAFEDIETYTARQPDDDYLGALLASRTLRRDAYVIFVQADEGDDAAIALYSKLGTREDVLHFDIAPSRAEQAPR